MPLNFLPAPILTYQMNEAIIGSRFFKFSFKSVSAAGEALGQLVKVHFPLNHTNRTDCVGNVMQLASVQECEVCCIIPICKCCPGVRHSKAVVSLFSLGSALLSCVYKDLHAIEDLHFLKVCQKGISSSEISATFIKSALPEAFPVVISLSFGSCPNLPSLTF